MNKLSKETYKSILRGEHSGLMQGIEDLIDMYNNKPWTDGYEACKDDVCVHSSRLAELIGEKFKSGEIPVTWKFKREVLTIETEDIAKVIEEYFENALKA